MAGDVNRERTFPVFLSLKHKPFRVPTGESLSQMHPTSTVWKPQIAAKKLQLEGKVVRSTWNIFLGVNSDIWRVDSIDPGKDWDCYFQFTNIRVLCQGKETVKSLPLSSLYPWPWKSQSHPTSEAKPKPQLSSSNNLPKDLCKPPVLSRLNFTWFDYFSSCNRS